MSKQRLYQCKKCGVEGPPKRVAANRWRWYYYIAVLTAFPFGLLLTLFNSRAVKGCSKCESPKLKRLKGNVTDGVVPDSLQVALNAKHRRMALALPVMAFVGYVMFGVFSALPTSTPQTAKQSRPDAPQLRAASIAAPTPTPPRVQKPRRTTRKPTRKPKTTEATREAVWIMNGKDAVKAQLKDPKSVTFRNVFFHRGANNIPVCCGEVNAKNSFGGYMGYQRFVSGATAELTFLEEDVEDFSTVWRALCVD